MDLSTQKVAIVTGASRGIGAAIAKRLSLEGFAVVVNYGHNQEQAVAVVREIHDLGGDAIAVQADVSQSQAVESLFDKAEKTYGGVDVLINNAGIYPDEGVNILSINRELLDKTLNTNTFGAIPMVQEFLPL